MTFTTTTPTKPGYYLWRTVNTSRPCMAEVLLLGDPGVLWVDTDSGREALSRFADVDPVVRLEWARLVPAEEIEQAWQEAEGHYLEMFGKSYWNDSRAKRVMEGGE